MYEEDTRMCGLRRLWCCKGSNTHEESLSS